LTRGNVKNAFSNKSLPEGGPPIGRDGHPKSLQPASSLLSSPRSHPNRIPPARARLFGEGHDEVTRDAAL